MSIFSEDDRPAPKAVHQIGQDLSMLSLAEIDQRIEALKAEIAAPDGDAGEEGRLALGCGCVLPQVD